MDIKAWYEHRPIWRPANNRGHIELYRDFCFWVQKNKEPAVPYWVPGVYEPLNLPGYVCDGASIPGVLSPVYGAWSEPINATGAWPHDPLYLTHALSRDICDEVARQIWIQAGKGEWLARQMWVGIRTGGALAWPNNAQDSKDLGDMRTLIAQRPDRDKFTSLWA